MFEVTQFNVCPATGITSFEMKWKTGQEVRSDQGSFLNCDDALHYIVSSKRSYILILFDDFVHQCRINFEIGDSEYYRHENKLSALERCSKYAVWFETKDFQTIIKIIQALQEDFKKILPKPSDKSFAILEGRIMDMIIFCKKELSSLETTPNR